MAGQVNRDSAGVDSQRRFALCKSCAEWGSVSPMLIHSIYTSIVATYRKAIARPVRACMTEPPRYQGYTSSTAAEWPSGLFTVPSTGRHYSTPTHTQPAGQTVQFTWNRLSETGES